MPLHDDRTAFDILGVKPGASNEELTKAYKSQALKFHPDKNPGDEDAADEFRAVRKAYETIINAKEGDHSINGMTMREVWSAPPGADQRPSPFQQSVMDEGERQRRYQAQEHLIRVMEGLAKQAKIKQQEGAAQAQMLLGAAARAAAGALGVVAVGGVGGAAVAGEAGVVVAVVGAGAVVAAAAADGVAAGGAEREDQRILVTRLYTHQDAIAAIRATAIKFVPASDHETLPSPPRSPTAEAQPTVAACMPRSPPPLPLQPPVSPQQ